MEKPTARDRALEEKAREYFELLESGAVGGNGATGALVQLLHSVADEARREEAEALRAQIEAIRHNYGGADVQLEEVEDWLETWEAKR